MFDLLFGVSIIGSIAEVVKEARTPTIPAENWANKELYHQDMMNGVPIEQRMKNLANGKYRMVNVYPEPHRDPVDGKIIIENSKLYHEDVRMYGAYQAQKWVEQGKYNLTPEEVEKAKERVRKNYEYLCSLI